MAMPDGPHLDRLLEAIAVEGRAHRLLLAAGGVSPSADAAPPHERGGPGADPPPEAAALLAEAAALYRASWELAPPASYGRLIGMLKAAVIGGAGAEAAAYARGQVPADAVSPPANYVRAIVALSDGDDAGAVAAAAGMRGGSDAFVRAADAIAALASGDADAYAAAVRAIVDDFAARDAHLTGVPIADTALMLERLAARRGLGAGVRSPLLPAA